MNVCEHQRSEVRWRNRSAGLIGRQCVDCGRAVGGWLPHDGIDKSSLPEWQEEREEPVARLRLVGVNDKDAKPVAVEDYEAYLGSAIWKRRRSKVIERANGICEGCLTNKAEQVHHLTYSNVGAEFAFELVALCESCHKRVHKRETERARAVA